MDAIGWLITGAARRVSLAVAVALAPRLKRDNLRRQLEGGGGSFAGVGVGFDAVWRPSAEEARADWEAQVEMPAPAPVTGRQGPHGGRPHRHRRRRRPADGQRCWPSPLSLTGGSGHTFATASVTLIEPVLGCAASAPPPAPPLDRAAPGCRSGSAGGSGRAGRRPTPRWRRRCRRRCRPRAERRGLVEHDEADEDRDHRVDHGESRDDEVGRTGRVGGLHEVGADDRAEKRAARQVNVSHSKSPVWMRLMTTFASVATKP